jgi:hypothetical protein
VSDVTHLTIPAEQVEGVTSTVLGLYGARAETLAGVLLEVVDPVEDRVEVEEAWRELRAMENALFDLGWPDRPPDRPVEIIAEPRLLRDVARAALLDSADRVVEEVRRYEAGSDHLISVRHAVESVPALLELFVAAEAVRDATDEDEL